MLTYPAIDSIAFHIASWPVHWYGLMYLIGFLGAWGLLSWRLHRSIAPILSQEQLSDMLFFSALGAIIGGRLGYMLFYDWPAFIADPFLVFQPWKGGMAFHGGLLGVLIGLFFCSKKFTKPFLLLTDF